MVVHLCRRCLLGVKSAHGEQRPRWRTATIAVVHKNNESIPALYSTGPSARLIFNKVSQYTGDERNVGSGTEVEGHKHSDTHPDRKLACTSPMINHDASSYTRETDQTALSTRGIHVKRPIYSSHRRGFSQPYQSPLPSRSPNLSLLARATTNCNTQHAASPSPLLWIPHRSFQRG